MATAQQLAFDQYVVPSPAAGPESITAGPDGAMWFTEKGGNIGRITTAGVVTEYPVPTVGSNPWGITAGPDGALWFTERFGGKIGRITVAGVITEYPLSNFSYPSGITAGPDGALWFASAGRGLGSITTAGVVTEYPNIPANGVIAAGPRGGCGSAMMTTRSRASLRLGR